MIHWISRKYGTSGITAYLQLRTERGLGRDEYFGSRPDLGPVHIGGLRDFTNQELERLCAPRNFSFEALKKQLCPSILKYVPHYSRHSAYALCDPLRRVAVLRRMDGQPWPNDEKAWNAPGSNTKIPIGIHAIASFAKVMLNEGGPDYLRLVSLLHECDFSTDILPLMMPSAISKIDPRVVNCFADKRVRICAQMMNRESPRRGSGRTSSKRSGRSPISGYRREYSSRMVDLQRTWMTFSGNSILTF